MKSLLALAVVLISTPAFAQDDCEAQTSDVDVASDAALESFKAMDVDGFKKSHAEAMEAVGCLTEPLTADGAARVHQLAAMAAFLGRDVDAAVNSFRSSRSASPDAKLPEDIAPAGHPLEKLFQQATPGDDELEALEPPDKLTAWVDGAEDASERPVNRPALVQLGIGAAVVQTDYLAAGAPAPDWTEFHSATDGETEADPDEGEQAEPEPAPEPRPSANRGDASPRVPLAVAAFVSAAASGGLYASANAWRTQFDDPDTDFSELGGLRRRTNGSVTASGIAGAAAIGLGVAAFTVDF